MDPQLSSVCLDIESDLFPDLMPVYQHWSKLLDGRFAPSRADFDPTQVPGRLLSRMMMVDVLEDPPDFRYRLWGTAIRDLHGFDLKGRSVRELKPKAYAELIWQQYTETVERAAPALYVNQVPGKSNLWHRQGVLRLPFSSDGESVDIVLSVDYYGKDREELKIFFLDARSEAPAEGAMERVPVGSRRFP